MQVALLVSLHDFGKLHIMKELILPTKAEETKHNTTPNNQPNFSTHHCRPAWQSTSTSEAKTHCPPKSL